MFCLELRYSVEKYSIQLVSIFTNKIMKLQQYRKKIHISRLELPRWHLDFVISFSKEFIWDLGLRSGLDNSFRDHVIQISFRKMNFFCIYFPNYEKWIFCGTFTPYNQILIFEEPMFLHFPIWIFIFVTGQA
jgi:hypothetical protein